MRAKAESLGIDAKGGLMERAERIIAVLIGLAINPLLIPILWLMLVLTTITAVQRFWQGLEASGRRAGHRSERIEMRRSATCQPEDGANRAAPHTRAATTAADHPRRTLPEITDAFTTNGYKLGALAARVTPGVFAAGLATPVGAGANFFSPERRAMIERHLRRVDPTLRGLRLRRASQEAFDFYARYWIESFRLPTLSKRAVERGFTEDGYPHIVEALREGNGVIIALPHLGGWEWAGRWIANQGHEITVVVEQLDPPELFEWFVDLRSKLGMHVVPLGPESRRSGDVGAYAKITLCVCCSDRDIGQSGPEVEFFGERTTLPGGAATIALRTGAPILPTAVYFTDRFDGASRCGCACRFEPSGSRSGYATTCTA